MLLCNKCKFKKTIPGDNHIGCSRSQASVRMLDDSAIKNGYFLFPFNFDPQWGSECDSFIKKSLNLRELDEISLGVLFKIEKARFELIKNPNKKLYRFSEEFLELSSSSFFEKLTQELKDEYEDNGSIFSKDLKEDMISGIENMWKM